MNGRTISQNPRKRGKRHHHHQLLQGMNTVCQGCFTQVIGQWTFEPLEASREAEKKKKKEEGEEGMWSVWWMFCLPPTVNNKLNPTNGSAADVK